MRDKRQMLVLLLLPHQRLLRREGGDCHSHSLINPRIDDPRCIADQIQPMPIGNRDEGDPQEIVFRDDLAHVQSVVETLDAMHRRVSPDLFIRNRALPTKREIACDLRHQVGQMIR